MTISVRLSVIMIADKQSQLRSNHCNKYKHYGNYHNYDDDYLYISTQVSS